MQAYQPGAALKATTVGYKVVHPMEFGTFTPYLTWPPFPDEGSVRTCPTNGTAYGDKYALHAPRCGQIGQARLWTHQDLVEKSCI